MVGATQFMIRFRFTQESVLPHWDGQIRSLRTASNAHFPFIEFNIYGETLAAFLNWEDLLVPTILSQARNFGWLYSA